MANGTDVSQQQLPAVDPQRAAGVLQTLFPMQASGIAPSPSGGVDAAGPVSGAPAQAPTGDPTQSTLTNMAMSAFTKGSQAAERGVELGKQQREVPIQTTWAPHFGGGFLHNLGQAMMLIGASTRPGQAVLERIEAPKFQHRAQEIAGIQAEQEPTEKAAEFYGKGAEAAGRLSYERGLLGVRQQHEQSYADRVQGYLQSVANTKDWRSFLQQLDTEKLSLQEKTLAVHKALGEMGIQVQQQRNQVIASLGGQRISLDADKFNAAVQNSDQGFFDQIMIDLGMRKPAQITQGAGTTPYQGAPTKPGVKPAATGGKMRVKLSDGRTGTIDAKDFDAKTMTKVQ